MSAGRELFLMNSITLKNVDSVTIKASDSYESRIEAMIYSVGLVVSVVIYAIQLWFSCKFFKRTNNIKEVGFLTRKLIIVGNVAGLSQLLTWAFKVKLFLTD